MTRDEILAMGTGRELDALVAEKVMGWTDIDCSEVKWTEFMGRKTENHMLGPIDRFSSDMSAAWEVWRKMQRKFLHMNICWFGNKYMADIINEDTEEGYRYLSQVECETAPDAICKAALLAIMD